LARAGIEAAEEECCDAWVVGGLLASPRRYAEALLATIDFVAELRRPCLPPGACPANRGAPLLQRRLVGIVHAEKPRRLRGGVAVRAAATAVLVVQPLLQAAPPEEAVSPPPDPVITETLIRPQAPHGARLLVLDAEGGISVCDPNTLAVQDGWSLGGPANSIACGPDGQTVAVAFGSWLDAETGWVECWSIPQRRRLATYRVSAPVGAARFGPDGRTLIVGGWNGFLTWRSLPGGELIAERQLPKGLVAAAAFSPDAGTLPLDPPPEPEPPPTFIPQIPPGLLPTITHLPRR
jgi:hypothetical protein